jgi:hypothetical protein
MPRVLPLLLVDNFTPKTALKARKNYERMGWARNPPQVDKLRNLGLM